MSAAVSPTVDASLTRRDLERRYGVTLVRKWGLQGPGPARYGYWEVQPCREVYRGASLAEVRQRLAQ